MSSELMHAAAASFGTGVAVVSVRDELDDVAMTATSFTSVSLEPPLISVCVDYGTHMHDVLYRTSLFSVSILGAGQRSIAGRFGVSGRPSARLLLSGNDHHRGHHTEALIVDHGTAALECQTTNRIKAGDHTVLIAAVLAVDYINDEVLPLLRYRSQYLHLT